MTISSCPPRELEVEAKEPFSFFMLSYTNFLLKLVVSFAEQPSFLWRISQFYLTISVEEARSLLSQFRAKNGMRIDLKPRTMIFH